MKLVFFMFLTAMFCSAAYWKVTEQTDKRIVLELVEEATPPPIPDPPPPIPDPPLPPPFPEDPAEVPVDGTQWIMGYYPGYQSGLYPIDKVDFVNMTHLIVGRVVPNNDGTLTTTLDIDATQGPALAKSLSALAHQNHRKALLMIGGAGAHAGFVASSTDAMRPTFVNNLLKVMDDFGYDGLDIDWEPIQKQDQPNVLALVKDLRAKRPDMLLTIPVGWINPAYQKADPWFKTVEVYVDRLNIMSYVMAGAWEGWRSWHSSALRGQGSGYPTSIEASVNAYKSAGITPGKLGIGVGFFGVCWKGVTEPRQALNGASIAADDNTMSYTNIMSTYFVASGYRWDQEADVPYLSYPNGYGPLGCNFISAEDELSVAKKGEYVRANALGGAIIWTINQGYLPNEDTNPLLISLAKGMFSDVPVEIPPTPTPTPTPDPGDEVGSQIKTPEVFGVLTEQASPYYVFNNIQVPKGKTLVIEPGVKLIFKGLYKMVVEGILISEGTAAKPILFTAEDKDKGWHGLRWESTAHDTTPMNVVTYTIFEYGNKTTYFPNGSYKENRAGAMFVYKVQNIKIENNVFRYNKANDKCGAVMMLAISAPISFKNNVFDNNEAKSGGALCLTHGRIHDIFGGSFTNNKATSRYGGLYVFDTYVNLHGVTFSGNTPNNYGGDVRIVN